MPLLPHRNCLPPRRRRSKAFPRSEKQRRRRKRKYNGCKKKRKGWRPKWPRPDFSRTGPAQRPRKRIMPRPWKNWPRRKTSGLNPNPRSSRKNYARLRTLGPRIPVSAALLRRQQLPCRHHVVGGAEARDALERRDLRPAVGGARAVLIDADERIAAALGDLHEIRDRVAHGVVDAVQHVGDVDDVALA